MKFDLSTDSLDKAWDCLIIGVYENNKLTPSAEKIDKKSQQFISKLLKKGEIQGKLGQTLVLHSIPNIAAERVLLVGCGTKNALKEGSFRKIVTSSIKAALNTKTIQAGLCLAELEVEGCDLAWKIKQMVELSSEAMYCFQDFKSKKDSPCSLNHFSILLPNASEKEKSKTALKQGIAIAEAVTYTKNIANLPSNICNPAYLAKQAQQLKKEYKNIKIKVLEEKEMAKLGMNALLAVAKGSEQDPKLICIEYKGTAKKQSPVALIGKGITFDTGGISLKPADAMIGMKYDMCGAATVLGTIKAVAELQLPIHVVGIIASAENMPSGTATKPEDIVTTLSGQTVEIMNTDAEGRLVLCDALTYSERYQPNTVIDIATLTGAVVIALGHHASGLLSNNDPLAEELLKAGRESFDRAWQLPLWEEYQEQLKSPFADMSNVGGRAAGTITAACFLSRFAKKFHWAHLDVAGTAAMMGGNDRYATGRPVPLLTQFLINRSTMKKK